MYFWSFKNNCPQILTADKQKARNTRGPTRIFRARSGQYLCLVCSRIRFEIRQRLRAISTVPNNVMTASAPIILSSPHTFILTFRHCTKGKGMNIGSSSAALEL
jgi:hypothetical protein